MINEGDLPNSPKSSLKLLITDGPVESAASSVENLYKEGVLDPVYHAKTLVLNRALQEIGMGKYQVIMTIWLFMKPFVDILLQVHAPFGGRDGMVCVSHVKVSAGAMFFLTRWISITEIAFGRSVVFF